MKAAYNRKMTALLCALALAGQALTAGPAAASERSALDAFNALVEAGEHETEAGKDLRIIAVLDEIMTGAHVTLPSVEAEMREMAGKLPAFTMITDADLAFYASERDQFMARVRNVYYKSLAAALQAKIRTEPAAEGDRANAEIILDLFLAKDGNAQAGTQKETLRGQMTEAYCSQLAAACDLPEDFVGFIIMDSSWDDEDWKNDSSWKQESGWYTEAETAFAERNVGSRDAEGETVIRHMQEQLAALEYLSGKPDGVFGPRTQAALLEFQLANGMLPTGIYTVYEAMCLDSSRPVARWDYDDEFWDPDDDDYKAVWNRNEYPAAGGYDDDRDDDPEYDDWDDQYDDDRYDDDQYDDDRDDDRDDDWDDDDRYDDDQDDDDDWDDDREEDDWDDDNDWDDDDWDDDDDDDD